MLNSHLQNLLPKVLRQKDFLKNSSIFTEKHLSRNLDFNKVTGLAFNFIKKETLTQVLSCEYSKTLKDT